MEQERKRVKAYEIMQDEYNDMKETLKEQLLQQQQVQKMMQEEVIRLAARNSNLEHQKDEYSQLLDQREYEIVHKSSTQQTVMVYDAKSFV